MNSDILAAICDACPQESKSCGDIPEDCIKEAWCPGCHQSWGHAEDCDRRFSYENESED